MKIVFKIYINISIYISLFTGQFNLEVPLLENYIGQLRGARGNSWEWQQKGAVLETKFYPVFFIYKKSWIAYPLFPPVCKMHIYIICIHYWYLKD